ncbi:hypothetical protein [Aquimarina sp. LLG6339-5]|uniref:hypothetical protein n=1 Tax=Aquimarina sp. LLG6339-5 TaxID=3160830 RepID=UPI003862ECAD
MKTKLLYLISFLLVFFTSCSIDESANEISLYEKEMAVKNLFDSFSKSVVHSTSYAKIIEEIQIKSSSNSSEEEMQQLEQEFLSLQSDEFVELYYSVKSLNLTKEEIRDIVVSYFVISGNLNKGDTRNGEKDDSDDCAVSDTINSPLFVFLAELVCEIARSSSD